MNPTQLKRGGFGLTATAAILIAVWFSHWNGMYRSIDNWIGDQIQQWTLDSRGAYRVLLVYASPDILRSPDQLESLMDQIDQAAPRAIGLIAESTVATGWESNPARWGDRVVLGITYGLFASPADASKGPSEVDFGSESPVVGFIDLDLNGQSVYRRHWASVGPPRGRVESLERQIARRLGRPPGTLPDGAFQIRFAGGVNGLPHIDAQQVLDGEVIPELLQGRVVLVGARTPSEYGLVTPTCRGGARMGRLELHGNITECVLERNWIRETGWLSNLCWIMLATVVSIQTFRQCSPKWFFRLIGLLAMVCVTVAALSFSWLNVQIPVSAMLASILVSAAYQWNFRFSVLRRAAELWHLMTQTEDAGQDESDPDRVWDLITDAVYQMFCPERMALMELKPHATHLSVVRTIHCTPESIYEQRRDIQRQPYRDSLDCGKPLRIASRCFFSSEVNRGETEFMVPLNFAGQPLGFMVLTMDADSLEDWQDIEGFLEQFAQEMSVLVANDRASRKDRDARTRCIGRLRETPEEQMLTAVQHHQVAKQGELNRLSTAYEIAESALAMCDVFGQVLRCNSRFLNLLQAVDVTPNDTNCVEMISTLTGRSQHECRRMFRMAIIHRRAEQIFVPANQLRDYACILMLKPLSVRTTDAEGEIESRRVMVEVVEGRVFERVHQWKNRLRMHSCQRALGSVRRLEAAVSDRDREEQGSIRVALDPRFEETLRELRELLSDCQKIDQSNWDEDPENVVPVDWVLMLQNVMDRFTKAPDRRDVDWSPKSQSEVATVVANPLLLERVLTELWQIVLRHSQPDERIRISNDAAHDKRVLQIHTNGVADPVDGLRKSLLVQGMVAECGVGASWAIDLNRDSCQQIQAWVAAWEGALTLRIRDDLGLSIELILNSDDRDETIASEAQRPEQDAKSLAADHVPPSLQDLTPPP